jgi:serine/threonine-protein kinase
MALARGQILNQTYRVERLLGAGGMADVYLVSHTRLPRQFALKLMKLGGGEREQFLARFRREGEVLAGLRHPHIVDVVDTNQLSDGSPYLIMELLDGEDLAARLQRVGPFSVIAALEIAKQVGEALGAAHAAGVVHRDLKPSNIFLCRSGPVSNYVKILDFGIAKLVSDERTPLTLTASLMGTPGYMAPEQALGRLESIDGRTDQFALAAVLYELLSGRPAFHRPGDAVYAILGRVVNDQPPPLTLPAAHAQLQRAIERGLSKRQEDRYPEIRDFLAALGATSHTILELSPSQLSPPNTLERAGELTLPQRRRRLVYASLGAGLVALGGLALLFRDRPLAPPLSASASLQAPPELAPAPTLVLLPSAPIQPAMKPRPAPASDPAAAAKAPVASIPLRSASKPALRPAKSGPLLFQIQGTRNPVQEHAIRLCAKKELSDLALPVGTILKMERSGTLQLVDAPPAVHDSSFAACLRQAFQNMSQLAIPESVTIRVGR